MADPYHTEPATPKHYRIANLKGFLPLSDDSPTLSTRGQALPALISSRSSTNIADLKKRAGRPGSTYGGEELARVQTEGGHKSDHEHGRQPSIFVWGSQDGDHEERLLGFEDQRRFSILMTPEMRSQRLIGNSNPRYQWAKYYKTEEQLKDLKKPVRKYYERCNYLIQHYMYIDRLLDSSLPHDLIQEYQNTPEIRGAAAAVSKVPDTIDEEPSPSQTPRMYPQGARQSFGSTHSFGSISSLPPIEPPATNGNGAPKVNRTKDLYRLKPDDEHTPLLRRESEVDRAEGAVEEYDPEQAMPPGFEPEEDADSGSRVVTIAIYINLVANAILLIMKIVVVALSSSVSVLASLVDAALDFLSTAIVWTTTYLIARNDDYSYPIGRRRLEPIGVLVFSVIMITSFVQVALEGAQKLSGKEHELVQLGISAIAIMAATVVIKFMCWLYCRLINNSSVQALAQDAMTDVVFNTFSIIFPLVGFYAGIWWLDPLGGILLSLYVIFNWSRTTGTHIRNLTGAAASADERNIMLYLTMRFAKTIKQIQGLQAYHSGDKLNVEVDIVLDEHTSLRDSHDLGESLQYVLESVPNVDRAFVHLDYAGYNLPTHMRQ